MYLIYSPSLFLANLAFSHEVWLLNSSGRTCKAGTFTHWATSSAGVLLTALPGVREEVPMLEHDWKSSYITRLMTLGQEKVWLFFFGHKIVGFDYKNSACTDGNVGERRVEFIALCLNYFLPRLCCFFISTTGGRLLGDLLCESFGQISCYWQPKVKLIPLFIFFLRWSVRDQTQDLEYGTQMPYHWAVSPSNSFPRHTP